MRNNPNNLGNNPNNITFSLEYGRLFVNKTFVCFCDVKYDDSINNYAVTLKYPIEDTTAITSEFTVNVGPCYNPANYNEYEQRFHFDMDNTTLRCE